MRVNGVLVAAVASVLTAVPAVAVVVPDTPAAFASAGDSFAINFSQGYDDGTPLPGLTAEAIFTLSSFGDGTQWTFDIDYLANTSSAPVTQSRLVSFGFDVSPNVTSVGATGMFDAGFSGNNLSITNGLKVEVCFNDVGNNCSGGGNGGLWGGQSVTNQSIPNAVNPTNTFTLNFAAAQSLVTLNNFVVRYQDIQAPDAGFALSGSGVGTAAVPEPAAWAMLIAGFGLVGGVMRRRRSVVAVA